MFTEFKFDGGRIVARESGEMFDSKTGKKTSWDKGIKILGESKPITLTVRQIHVLSHLLEDDEFLAWVNAP